MRIKRCPNEYCFECSFLIKDTGQCTKPWEEEATNENKAITEGQ